MDRTELESLLQKHGLEFGVKELKNEAIYRLPQFNLCFLFMDGCLKQIKTRKGYMESVLVVDDVKLAIQKSIDLYTGVHYVQIRANNKTTGKLVGLITAME